MGFDIKLFCYFLKLFMQSRMSLLIHTPKKNTKNIEKRIELMLSTIKMSVPSNDIKK